jgi:hypothetical protein
MRAKYNPKIRPVDRNAPSLKFDWLQEALPAGPWSPSLREALCNGIKTVGWEAVNRGEFLQLESLYRDFTSILPRLFVDRSDIDHAADLYTLVHIMLWRRTQLLSGLKGFNTDVVNPFVAYLDRHFPKVPPRAMTRDVPRIAYLSETSDLFGSNAVARITVSLMLGQNELRSVAERPILYCINHPADELYDFALEHGLEVRDVARPTPSQSVEAIIGQLGSDDIDILIADSNCAVATMVFQRRPARVQAFHENGFAAWSIPELDLAFMGITMPSKGLFDDQVEMVQTPRNTAFVFQNADRPADVVESVRDVLLTASGVAQPSAIYGFYGRMAKVTAEYMAQVEALLVRDPKAIFFAGGTGRISPITECMQRSPVADRMVIYNDFIDGHVVAECLDVFLDTFPFPGGMSCIEVQARGVPVVWMPAPENDQKSIIGDQRDERLRACSVDHYVEIASKLADPAERSVFAETARAIVQQFGDMRGQAEQVEGHLQTAWDKAGQHKNRIAA